MNLLTRVVLGVWLVLIAVVAAARVGNVEPLEPAASAFIADGTVTAPVSIVALLTIAFFAVAWRVEVAEREREEAAILREKPALVGDRAAIARERRVRRKELEIKRQEEKAMKHEATAERAEKRAREQEKKIKREEVTLERRREMLRAKREEIHDREALGR